MKSKMINILLLSIKVITKIFAIIAKVGKVALAGVSLAVYSYMYSWKFALFLMLQLLIHEYGHIWAMKKVGIKTKGIYFIPFVGGAAVASEDFKTRKDETFVALMGPVFGFACAFAMMVVYYITENPMYAAAASWMAMINLFNLLPINPLDGGRVMKCIAFSIHSWFGFVFLALGIIASIFLAVFAKIWLFILVVIISSIEFAIEFYFERKRKEEIKLLQEEVNKQVEKLKEAYKKENIEIPENSLANNPPDYSEMLNEGRKPPMSGLDIAVAVIQYFILAITLYLFMAMTSHIPGADLAKTILDV